MVDGCELCANTNDMNRNTHTNIGANARTQFRIGKRQQQQHIWPCQAARAKGRGEGGRETVKRRERGKGSDSTKVYLYTLVQQNQFDLGIHFEDICIHLLLSRLSMLIVYILSVRRASQPLMYVYCLHAQSYREDGVCHINASAHKTRPEHTALNFWMMGTAECGGCTSMK